MQYKANNFRGLKNTLALAGIALAIMLAGGERLATAQDKVAPADMTPTQMQKTASKYMGEMKGVLQLGFDQLAEARGSQDIDKLNSVNEALSAVKGLLRLAEQNMLALQEAVSKRDKARSEQEFVKLSIAYHKVMDLGARIRAASGKMTVGDASGQAQVVLVKDDDLPQENPLEDLNNAPPVDVGRPPQASPYFPTNG